ncbi:nicotinate (nicotinamide) nucleotide adenylyltransferase [Chondromyces crocatus]|uniref:nicotinate (nicotinamide) nucleotide adenylyltransferase n=1 Tax=Chondromyces crocatus TaxID=52 RepID=UPI0007C68522
MGAARRVAIFGGSFNPPHVSHVLAVTYALSVAPVDAVVVVPVFQHPFAKELVPYEDRLEMCRLALGWIPSVEVSTVERELGGESLTLRTLEHLAAVHPGWSMRLLVGADVLPDLPKWHRFDRIAELAPPLVLGRAGIGSEGGAAHGLSAPEAVLPEVSSTEVRRALAAGDLEAVRWQVPRVVLEYALERGLYGVGRG